ncbi:MAG: hypothetical protein KAR73_11935, partial [Spirochaetales bacterium]|nr:hypothetical protein [Spirochaetales bacterium]
MISRSGNPRRQAGAYVFGERGKVDLARFGRKDWRETPEIAPRDYRVYRDYSYSKHLLSLH